MTETDKLHRQTSKAVQARQELDEYKPYAAELQKKYLVELVMKARNGQPTETAVYKLVALDDLINDLKMDIDTGVRAGQKLEAIALQKDAQG